MNDLISRQAAIDAIDGYMEKLRIHIATPNDTESYSYARGLLVGVINDIKQLPPIQPKRGKWIRTGSGSLYDHYECSECGKPPKWECMGNNRWKIAFTDFCPNCGAKMEMTTPPECEGDCGWCKPTVIEKCKGVTT